MGGILEMCNARPYKFWNDLGPALKSGQPQNEVKHSQKPMFETLYEDLPRLEQFMGAMAGLSRGNFMTLAEKFDFSKYKTLCDVGGATGLLSTLVAKKHPHMRCTSFDLPAVEPIAKKVIAREGLSDRIQTASGDFFKDGLPKADVVAMGMILHDWNLEKKKHLIKVAYDALPEDGALIAVENIIDAKMIQHTIQLTPRLSEPTLVTAVLVEQNVHVKKGTPLFQFDRRTYEYKVKQLEAQLAEATQNVLILKADIQVTAEKIVKLKSQLEYSKYQQQLSQLLAQKGAGPEEDAQKWTAQVAADDAGIKEAQAEEQRARLRYQSEIGGVNTTVAAVQAELDQARFFLDSTTMAAPEDGYIINLQVRPGMVAGDYRMGAIASFICDADRYLLATFFQENLKYVKPGQVVEAALDLYPGQIWRGKVEAIWQGSGLGQLLPSGTLPDFKYVPTQIPQGQFAVVIGTVAPGRCTVRRPQYRRETVLKQQQRVFRQQPRIRGGFLGARSLGPAAHAAGRFGSKFSDVSARLRVRAPVAGGDNGEELVSGD
jgi:multidrug resistance efflux pump